MKLENLENNIELGRQVFEAVPSKIRPMWGITILQAFESYINKVPNQIKELYHIVENEKNWDKAHDQFSKIRIFSLTNRNFQPESYLLLAEKIAKITYNESGLAAPFDKDSGWWIAICAKHTADHFDDSSLNKEILRILTVNLDKK